MDFELKEKKKKKIVTAKKWKETLVDYFDLLNVQYIAKSMKVYHVIGIIRPCLLWIDGFETERLA